jgi:hypothetical protein
MHEPLGFTSITTHRSTRRRRSGFLTYLEAMSGAPRLPQALQLATRPIFGTAGSHSGTSDAGRIASLRLQRPYPLELSHTCPLLARVLQNACP